MSKEDLKNWKQEGEKKVANDLHDILVKLDGTRWMIAKKQKKQTIIAKSNKNRKLCRAMITHIMKENGI